MAVDSLGYVNYNRVGVYPDGSSVYYDPKKAKKKSIYTDYNPETGQAGKNNPFKDKVYLDPKTGEYTTWKPGIYNPEQQDSNKAVKRAAGLAAIVAAVITAIVFRGKIKTGATKALDLAKPYIDKIVAKTPKSVKDIVKKGLNVVKPAVTKAKDVVKKGYDVVKPYVTKVTEFATQKVLNPIKNLFVKAPKVAASV